jgi:hypothetical protein
MHKSRYRVEHMRFSANTMSYSDPHKMVSSVKQFAPEFSMIIMMPLTGKIRDMSTLVVQRL